MTLPHTRSTVCVPSGLPGDFYAFWIPMLISESVLCGLALFRGFQSYRPGSNVFQSGRRIIEILVRDSLSYFVMYVLPVYPFRSGARARVMLVA